MLNPKLGLSALLLEVGAWSGPLLQQHSDDALAAYLLLHAVASVLLTLFLLPLLPRERAQPRIPLVVLIVACCYAVPLAGFLGVLAAALSLHYLGRTHSAEEYESVQLPEFDLHQHRQGNFRHAGLRSFLGNSEAPIQARMRAMVAPAEAVFLDAKLEAELAELPEDEALELLQSVGQDESGIHALARVGFATLGLQTYLTAGPKESRAWTIPKGATAPEAAGVIHTDFQKGFIKAEVVSFDDLTSAGSMAEAKARGRVRIEGKDYAMADGDVVEFRFNV